MKEKIQKLLGLKDMNDYENLEKLLEKSEMNDYTLYTKEDLIDFGMWVARECASLCDNHGNKVEDDRPNKDLSSAAFDCSDIIREHFGVA